MSTHPITFDEAIDRARARVSEKAILIPFSDCHYFGGLLNAHGYGMVKVKNKLKKAHRLAYEAIHGEIPRGLVVMHRCDEPSCINVAHLSVGSPKDNTRDMLQKGRDAMRHRRKMSDDDVAHALRLIRGGCTQRDVAAKFGVGEATISYIKNGKMRFGERASA